MKAVAGAIFYARASVHLSKDLPTLGLDSSIDYSSLRSIQPPELRWNVLRIVSSSIQVYILPVTLDCTNIGHRKFGQFVRHVWE